MGENGQFTFAKSIYLATSAITTLASSIASSWPMQFLGPRSNAKYVSQWSRPCKSENAIVDTHPARLRQESDPQSRLATAQAQTGRPSPHTPPGHVVS